MTVADLVVEVLVNREAVLLERVVTLEAELAAEREIRSLLLAELHAWARNAPQQQRRDRQIQAETQDRITHALAAEARRSEAA